MKKFATFGKRFICFFLVISMIFLTACTGTVKSDNNEKLSEANNYHEYLEEELGVEVVQNDETVSYVYTQDNCEMSYNNDNGELCYTDEDGTFTLEITDVSEDGIISWQIKKQDEVLVGQVNTSDAPSPQMAIAIAGTSYLVYTFIYSIFQAAVVVTIAGATCYLASEVAEAIKKNSKKYNYFPAYNVSGNVYVATNIGLSKSTAVSRIKSGKHVWAKNANYAYSACIAASPIGAAEWGWHGNQKTSSGYYPHYHAVKYYKSNGSYVHTGAHCWYM